MKPYITSANGDNTFGYLHTVGNKSFPVYVPVAENILMTDAYQDIDSDNVTFDISFDGMTFRTSFIDLKEDFPKRGYPIPRNIENDIFAYLRQQYNDLQSTGAIKRIYEDIGWHKGFFRGYSANAPNGTVHYNGIFDLKPRGTKVDFVADLQKIILGHTELELSVILGLSACTVGFLKSQGLILDSLVVNIFGSSTTGKTTSAKLAVSMGGSPQNTYTHASLARTCSATQNALIAQLRGNNGYPVLFDELGMLDKKVNIPQLVFDIATGSGKQRLDKACNFRFDKTWATLVIFTGEASLLEGQKVVDGINMRVLTFDNAKWTTSSKQAHEVEQFSLKYSGLPITLLADYITKMKSILIIRTFSVITSVIEKRLSIPAKYRERKAKSVAVIMLTALLFQRAFGVKFNIKNLENFIIFTVNRTCSEEMWRVAYWDFVQYVAMNSSLFTKKNADPFVKKDFVLHTTNGQHFLSAEEVNAIGFLCYSNNGNGKAYAVGITEAAFAKWFEDSNFQNKEETLRQWRDTLKVLILPKGKEDRFKVNNVITEHGAEVPCYHILLVNESDSESEEDNSKIDRKDSDGENQSIVA